MPQVSRLAVEAVVRDLNRHQNNLCAA
jgi:hypothetical protein